MSKYLNRVLEVNAAERWARVQPGVVLDELNAQLRPHGLWFAPDVSTSNRATFGGMIGNNSSGARSIVYGKTHRPRAGADRRAGRRHTLAARPLRGRAGAGRSLGDAGRASSIGRSSDSRDPPREIVARYPKILRRVGGYDLDEFVNGQPFNLAKLLVGSEGTLATTWRPR